MFARQFAADQARLRVALAASSPSQAPHVIQSFYHAASTRAAWTTLYTTLLVGVGSAFAQRTASHLVDLADTNLPPDLDRRARAAVTRYAMRYIPQRVDAMLLATAARVLAGITRAQVAATNQAGKAANATPKPVPSVPIDLSDELLDEAIGDVFDGLSTDGADFLAENEVVRAGNEGMFAGAEALDIAVEKVWLPIIDNRTRPWHAAMDGVTAPLNEPFDVDGEPMQFPLDTSLGATAKNLYNCRCVIFFQPAAVETSVAKQRLMWKIDWNEDDHPRDERGRFESGGGEGGEGDAESVWSAGAPKSYKEAEMRRERCASVFDKEDVREEASETKARVTTTLGKALVNNPEWMAYVRSSFTSATFGGLTPEAASTDVANQVVRCWAGSSADSALAIVLQDAVRDEFGLQNVAQEHYDPNVVVRAGEYDETVRAGARAFERAQYENTQEYLRQCGIESMTLYRGMTFRTPEEAEEFGSLNQPPALTRVQTQPASSWSYDPGEALSFAEPQIGMKYGVVLSMTVPRERILSTAETGQGCKNEAEVIVLGGSDKVVAQAFTHAYLPSERNLMSYAVEENVHDY